MSQIEEEQFAELVFPPVLTKHGFVERYAKGEFGNASPTFDKITDFLKEYEHLSGLFHIRNRVKGGPTWYDVPVSDVASTWERVCSSGLASPDNLYISAMAPTPLTTIQGEVFITRKGIQLYYSNVKAPMREALQTQAHEADGITSKGLLQHYMNPKSYDWLQVLFERYPEHVIEFSCYSICWGTLPGYNTVFWEIRQY